MPIRIIFKDRDRTADITLVNTSDTEATFRLSWSFMRQNEDTTYTRTDTSPYPFLDFDKMVLFSPRQVMLPPGGKQRIRLSFRRPPDLPDGEYHAHLRLQRLGGGQILEQNAKKPGRVEAVVGVNVGFALPVIIRQGSYNATATISDPRFIPAPAGAARGAKLEVWLNRTGTHGTMGRLKVFWTPQGGSEKQIGLLNNVNIFTEINRRLARVPLDENYIPSGIIRVIYEGDGEDKGNTFDERIFPVGG